MDVRCDHNKCRGVDRVDQSPRDHHQSTCAKGVLSDAFDNLPGDTWTHQEHPIFIERAKQAEGMGHVLQSWATRGRMMTFDLHRTALVKGECGPRHGPRFHQFHTIGWHKSHREMDGSYSLREYFFKNRCILSSSLNF